MDIRIAKKCLGMLVAGAVLLGTAADTWADVAEVDGVEWHYWVSSDKDVIVRGPWEDE